jgi:hypothetical protein
MSKTCTLCGIKKDTSEFVKTSHNKSGFRSYCKECQADMHRKWRNNNQEKNKERIKLWLASNPDRHRKTSREWRAAHPEKCREWLRRWRANNIETVNIAARKATAKRRKDPKYRLSNSISSGILMSVKKGTKARRHWEELVSFTAEQLKAHLEKLFTPEMSWDNYGSYWSIDHKTPIAVFNFERPEDIDFRLCWSLKNLQPMEKIANKRKSDKIEKPFQPSLALRVANGGCYE